MKEISCAKIMEEVISEMCEEYCKYPEKWDVEKEGMELCESEICEHCPLSRLIYQKIMGKV